MIGLGRRLRLGLRRSLLCLRDGRIHRAHDVSFDKPIVAVEVKCDPRRHGFQFLLIDVANNDGQIAGFAGWLDGATTRAYKLGYQCQRRSGRQLRVEHFLYRFQLRIIDLCQVSAPSQQHTHSRQQEEAEQTDRTSERSHNATRRFQTGILR